MDEADRFREYGSGPYGYTQQLVPHPRKNNNYKTKEECEDVKQIENILKNKYIYKGELKDNKKEGQGTREKDQGAIIYMGEFKNNQIHGEGKLILKNRVLKGKFKCGILTDGTVRYRYGNRIYDNTWVEE